MFFLQGFLYLYLPSLGIFLFSHVKSPERDFRWFFLTAPPVLLYCQVKMLAATGLCIPTWLWSSLRLPLWLLIPLSHHMAVGRKLRPSYTMLLALLTLLDGAALFLPVPVFFRERFMTVLLSLLLVQSVIAPLMHLGEIRGRFRRLASSAYFLALLFGLLYALPVSLSSLFLEETNYTDRIFGFVHAALALHGILAAALLVRLFSGDEKKARTLKVDRAFTEKYGISRKERDILHLLLEGYTARIIAEKVCLSTQTVKNYTQSIYQKTRVNSKMELLRKILEEQ
ncbi:MAG: response regulator transcription factor [Spirochaetales bacterium]|nr:response regulator transcription factor [Spirochaetales bacterium]